MADFSILEFCDFLSMLQQKKSQNHWPWVFKNFFALDLNAAVSRS
jgi:hypothetical protein